MFTHRFECCAYLIFLCCCFAFEWNDSSIGLYDNNYPTCRCARCAATTRLRATRFEALVRGRGCIYRRCPPREPAQETPRSRPKPIPSTLSHKRCSPRAQEAELAPAGPLSWTGRCCSRARRSSRALRASSVNPAKTSGRQLITSLAESAISTGYAQHVRLTVIAPAAT